MAVNKRIIRSNDEAAGGDFNTVTYTGNGSANHAITGVGFAPDLVWIKARSFTQSHRILDSVRPLGSALLSNSTAAEANYNEFSSFDNDGFTVKFVTNQGTNANGQDYVAWCWKAGGAAVTNTNGTITSQVSANVAAGFSVVSYTGNGTGSSTIGHGLGAAPSIILIKRRDSTSDWNFFYNISGSSNRLYLNTTGPDTNFATMTSFSSSTINLPSFNSTGWNESSGTYIAYCFSEVAGFSKFGSYTGTGSAGNSQTLGFDPAFIMFKNTSSTTQWWIHDNKRGDDKRLFAELSAAESTSGSLTTNATGFSFNDSNNNLNANGNTYIYMAFANQF